MLCSVKEHTNRVEEMREEDKKRIQRKRSCWSCKPWQKKCEHCKNWGIRNDTENEEPSTNCLAEPKLPRDILEGIEEGEEQSTNCLAEPKLPQDILEGIEEGEAAKIIREMIEDTVEMRESLSESQK